MSAITITETHPIPPIRVDTDDLELRGFYSQRFLDSDGVTPVYPGNGQSGFYYSIPCTRNADNELIIPAFDIRTTDGVDNVSSRFIGQLYVDGVADVIIFGYPNGPGWQIPEIDAPTTTWDELDLYNQGQVQYPFGVPTTLAAQIIIALIKRQLGEFAYMAVDVNGIGSASFAPVDAANPIVLMENDPKVGSWFNVLSYLASPTNTPLQNTTAIEAAITAATSAGGGIYIPAGTFGVNTLSITVPIQFASGAILRPTTSTTVTISKPITADTGQHFSNATAGLGTVLFTGTIDPVYASWFDTATAIATDLGPAASAAIASIAAVGGEVKFPRTATDLLTTVNGTGISAKRLKISGFGRGSLIAAKTSGVVAMDFTGSQFLELEDIHMSGDSTDTPTVGLLFARIQPGASNSAGINHIYNCELSGNWTVAPLYNYASEEMRVYDSHFENNESGGHCGVFTASNLFSVASVYKSIALNPPNQSMIDTTLIGCAWENFATSGDSDCLYLRGVSGFSSYGSFFLNNRRAFVHIDSDLANVNIDFKDSRFDSNGLGTNNANTCTYGFLQTGTLQNAYTTIEQTFDGGTANSKAGGLYTNVTSAATCTITTTTAHLLISGQVIVISGIAGTLGAAVNGPQTVTVTGAQTFTIPVDTTGLTGSFAAGYGGGRHFFSEGITAAHPASGSSILALSLSQYNATNQGSSDVPYVQMYTGDNCQIDVGVGGIIEVVSSSGTGAPLIQRSILQVPIANLLLGRPDFCIQNQILDYTAGGLMVGRRVIAKTTAYQIGGQEPNTLFTNTGASGSVTFTLPTDAHTTVGMTYEFYRDANQTVIVDVGGSVVIRVGTDATSAGGAATLAAVGSRLHLTAITTTLWIGDSTGSVTYA